MVDVKDITSTVPRSEFDVRKLEQLAQSILAAGGLLSPLLLKQTGAESYKVLTGDLEYYAAVRAKEISPRTAEMVNAFVVSDELAKTAVEQFKVLHRSSADRALASARSKTSDAGGQQIANLGDRMEELMRDFKQMHQHDMRTIEEKIKSLQEQLPTKVEPLEFFNRASIPDLAQKIAIAGIKGITAEKIIKSIEKSRNKAPFTSFKDVIDRVDNLADKRMWAILDSWGGLY
ncbi:MAG: hypothetical protein WBA76_15415 [Phormidesmis sp.]